jgi:hypothetical protein
MRIFKNAWFSRFAAKERITDDCLGDAVRRAENGLIDADLGGNVIKQRVARQGQGKSGGYRTLILFWAGSRAFFTFGFAKNDQDNISKADLKILKEAAKERHTWTDEQLDRLVADGVLEEIRDDEKP